MLVANGSYRGRLAPSPTGYLHLGHARTFWMAWQRARAAGGKLVFRNEDLDYQRCRPEFLSAMYEDLRWLGLDWDEGPDMPPQPGNSGESGNWVPHLEPFCGCESAGEILSDSEACRGGVEGPSPLRHEVRLYAETSCTAKGGNTGGPFGPYSQSERRSFYLEAWRKLRDTGSIYPCTCSRKDLERALSAPHEALHAAPLHAANETPDDELPYPGTCRNKIGTARDYDSPAGVSWRLRVPDGETISFQDGNYGLQQFVAGRDFADFLLWRRDDIPAYQLAVVVDDHSMQITEVVRGADLLKSTARQLLLFRALGHSAPAYFHCPLLRDEKNVRLAKRHDALSLRKLREQGVRAEELRKQFERAVSW
jgi:glutamyl/glutaminyl-tRNA synthetase